MLDISLVQELWMRNDHDIIKGSLPSGYYITSLDAMSNNHCDGEYQSIIFHTRVSFSGNLQNHLQETFSHVGVQG